MTEDLAMFGDRGGTALAEHGYTISRYMGVGMMRYHRGLEANTPNHFGQYYSRVDRWVADVRRRGFTPYLTITYQPGTYAVNPSTQDFRHWCASTASRYIGRISDFAVWNEPNNSVGGPYLRTSPSYYNQLYRACYDGIKTANPAARVYYGEIDAHIPGGCAWVEDAVNNGGTTYADGIAIHTYQWTLAPEQSMQGVCQGIGSLNLWQVSAWFWHQDGELRTPSGGVVPILVTEHGYCDAHGECPDTPGGAANRIYDENIRADLARRSFTWAQQHGVSVFSYYHLFNQPDGPTTWDTGIVDLGGLPLPAVHQLRLATGTQATVNPNLYMVLNDGATGSGHVELHVLSGSSAFTSYVGHHATPEPLHPDENTAWKIADVTRDGKNDLVMILHDGPTGSGKTEVHVLDGATNYATFASHRSTVMDRYPEANASWEIADANSDGVLDLFAIIHDGPTGSGKTEVHVLDGATNYTSFLAQGATVLGKVPSADADWQVADANFDGKLDVFMILHDGVTGSGKTEVHTLNGATNYTTFLSQRATVVDRFSDANSDWRVADANLDGKQDLYAVLHDGPTGSGKTEVHILSGATNYTTFLGQHATDQGRRPNAESDWDID